MMRAMVIRIPMQSGYGGVRHVAVSLPRVEFLLADMPAKSMRCQGHCRRRTRSMRSRSVGSDGIAGPGRARA
jgi:hypothetical protein